VFKRTIVTALLITGLAGLSGICASGQSTSAVLQATPAPQTWQSEFDEVCSKTQDAMTFSEEELAALIVRCDVLLPQLEKLDETRRKVYTARLRMCRGLYAYVLESKKNAKK